MRVSPSPARTRAVVVRRALERAHARRPDRPHASARRAPLVDRPRRVSATPSTTPRASRAAPGSSTSTGLNVPAPTCSSDFGARDAARRERGEQLGREVQARPSARRPSRLAREHRLIALGVVRARRRARCTAAAARGRSARSPRRAAASLSSRTMRVRRSVTSRISAVKPGAMSTRRPGLSLPPGDTIASYRPSPSGLSSRISAGAPEARVPSSRARSTRVRLTTSTSRGAISSTMSANVRCAIVAASRGRRPSAGSRRAARADAAR